MSAQVGAAHFAFGERGIAAFAAGGEDARRHLWRYRNSAWFRRASRTGEGLPRYSAAPSTRITSAGRASSTVDWRRMSRSHREQLRQRRGARPGTEASTAILI